VGQSMTGGHGRTTPARGMQAAEKGWAAEDGQLWLAGEGAPGRGWTGGHGCGIGGRGTEEDGCRWGRGGGPALSRAPEAATSIAEGRWRGGAPPIDGVAE
jgi:hypothetical protein